MTFVDLDYACCKYKQSYRLMFCYTFHLINRGFNYIHTDSDGQLIGKIVITWINRTYLNGHVMYFMRRLWEIRQRV